MPALIRSLLAIAPLELPGLSVFLVSQRNAKAVAWDLYALLDEDDRARAARLTRWDLQHRFVTGRGALRSILSMIEGGAVAAADWRFGTGTNGKPFVRSPASGVRSFNVSHGDDLIAIAVSEEVEVGVDIECGREAPLDHIPWHLFSDDEQRLLKATPVADFTRAFLKLWTLKEAIAKRTGQGFATEFSTLNTAEMPVLVGLASVARRTDTDALLFHTDLSVGDATVYLSVSTAPLGPGGEGTVR